MSTVRSDIRTRVRDYLYEATADWFSDAQLNRLITEEVLSLPSKGITNEAVYTTSLVDGQTDYTLPDNCVDVDKIEINTGTTTNPNWTEFIGWSVFNDSLYLDGTPTTTDEIRIFIQTEFTAPTGDIVALDMEDEVCEILVWGVVVRCYKMVIGYLRQAKNWDSVSKPDLLTISAVQGWLQEAKRDYNDLLNQYAATNRAKEINLVS
jgi:hypothetical protein